MKKFFTLVTVAFFSTAIAFASSHDKEFRKLIERFDVSDEAKATDPTDHRLFWKNLLNNNHLLFKDRLAMNKGGRAVNYALTAINNIPTFNPWVDSSINTRMQSFCDTMMMDMGIRGISVNCSLHCFYSDEPNAFCILTPSGFAMCFTSALLRKEGLTYEMLMGFVAHEFAHGILKHHVRELYAQESERIKNNRYAVIAAALYGIAAGANAYGAAMTGTTCDNSAYYNMINQLPGIAQRETSRYCFKYSREQEIEADLVAFRFLERLGCGDEFIMGLELLGSDYDDIYVDNSTHPSVKYRVQFLRYVTQHPEFYNKLNRKLKRKHERTLNNPKFKWKVRI